MKLKLDFVTKVPKVAKDNQVILINNKNIQNKIVKSVNKSIFANKLFLERKFLIQNINDRIYIVCKNNSSRMFQLKMDECLIFQKLSQQEQILLKALSYVKT